MNFNSVSVLGLGRLGSSMAAAFASKNVVVKAYDINENTIKKINLGRPAVYEPGLKEFYLKFNKKILGFYSAGDCIDGTDITFVVTPTPSLPNGSFNLEYTNNSFRDIALSIKKKKNFHLIVLVSTVLPGSFSKVLINTLEFYSKKKINLDFGVVYNPAFIALGSVMQNFLNPDFILIGSDQKKSTNIIKSFYKKILSKPNFKEMSILSAELTKLVLNTYITTKITYINMVSDVLDKLSIDKNGSDIDKISAALGSDVRIGNKYITAGIGYGGPCFPRDNNALKYISKKFRLNFNIATLTHNYNKFCWIRPLQKIKKYMKKNLNVCVIGIAYKEGSNVIEESQGLKIAKKLSKKAKWIYCYDPLSKYIDQTCFKNNLILTDDLELAVKKSKIIIIAGQLRKIEKINKNFLKNKIILDFWRILKNKDMKPKKYIALGYKK